MNLPAASVGPTGYTNAFDLQPPAADWATLSIGGVAADSYTADTDVNTNVTAGGVTAQTLSDGGNPPGAGATAVWSSSGLYLQTRPAGNRYTALMGKFLNNTGTNATQISISYLRTIAASVGVAEEAGKGTRVYYSLSGLANSWINLPGLNRTDSANGISPMLASVALNWSNGTSLFLLWTDDNASGAGADSANQLDNFSLRVTSGSPVYFTITVTFPTNNATLVSGTTIAATASVADGSPPYVVEYFTNSGAGNTVFASAGSNGTAPFNVSLGNLSAGTWNIYAVATGSAGAPTNSVTNTFYIADPIALVLTAPTNGASFDDTTIVTATATVSGGTPPYSVQFHLDGAANGAPDISSPYERTFGTLSAGDHTIRATVTDAQGWVSNSLVSTVHIEGRLTATLAPTNGASFTYGESLVLTALVAGGVSPYAVAFYVNDQLAGTRTSPPFATNLGVLPPGSYTCYVHATDQALPTAQQTNSSTNVIVILPNPLVVNLTVPTNGQNVPAGQAFMLAATAAVSAPVTLSGVEFFYDGNSVGTDVTAPYSAVITNASAGSHAVYAMATDSLGRTARSQTNTVTFFIDPLANDHFTNRFLLFGTPAYAAGANAGATLETGEPFQTGINRWGETLWWKWIAPVAGTVTIDTAGSSFNTFLTVYTGTAVNALTVVARNDNASLTGVGESSVTFNALPGTEYQIQVGGVFTGGVPVSGDIRVNVAVLPAVTITAPSSGSVLPAGSNIAVSATASSVAGVVTNVSLYRGATLLGRATSAPYNFVVSNAPPGTNTFHAVATDDLGQAGTSAVLRVLVANAGLTITAPADETVLLNLNPVTVTAFPMLAGGSITNVRFFVDGQLIAQDPFPPFSVSWNSVTNGAHLLTAVGLDNAGNTHYATPVHVSVARPFFVRGAVWKYLDNGSNQGTNWFGPNFDDSSWTNGPAELGYGDGDEATRVEDNFLPGYDPSETERYTTTYFRRAVVVTNAASYADLLLNVKCDDGAVVYLNGREAARFNMNTGAVSFITFARFAGDDGTTFVPVTVPAGFLVEGSNVVAVEVHQTTINSSDLSFDMEVFGIPRAALPLRIDFIESAAPEVVLGFRAEANVGYTLEHAVALDGWQSLQTFSPAPTNRILSVTRPASESFRFYRLRSP